MSPRKTIAWRIQGALKVVRIIYFCRNGHVFNHPVPIGATVNGQYYCALLKSKVRLAVRREQPDLSRCGVILLQDKAEPHCHNDVQNLVQH
jgi:hypothetical protein